MNGTDRSSCSRRLSRLTARLASRSSAAASPTSLWSRLIIGSKRESTTEAGQAHRRAEARTARWAFIPVRSTLLWSRVTQSAARSA
jgi:hypothetical protein